MTTGYSSLKIEVAYLQDPLTSSSLSWTDVSSRLRRLTITRGHQYRLDSFQPGTAQITLTNRDLQFDPNYNSSLLPMLPVRVSVNDSTSTSRKLFTGFVKPRDGFGFSYEKNTGETTFDCYDALGWMASKQLPPLMDAHFVPAPAYGGMTAGPMITALAAVYTPLFPAWQTASLDTGQTLMGDVPLGTDSKQFFDMLALSEGGAFYVLGDGTVNFDDRMAYFTKSRQVNSQVTFDESGATGVSWKADPFTNDYPPVYTTASVATLSDPNATYSYENPVPVANYGEAAFPPITGAYMSSSTEAQALAQRIVLTHSQPWFSPSKIRVSPRKNDTTLDACVQRELRDQVTVKNLSGAGTGTQTSLCHIESISHSIDVSGEWTCDFGFSSREQMLFNYDPSPTWIVLDGTVDGILDGSRQLAW
jgi:hypothetical protein